MNTLCEEHVVAIRNVYSICRSFDSLLEKALGPNGKSTLLNTATGQVLITNVGCTILRCMNIGHPLGTMIIKSIATHHSYTGDGSKTFMLYLTSILGSIASSADERLYIHEMEQRNSLLHALHSIRSQLFSDVLLPTVYSNCHLMNVCENKSATMTTVHNLVKSHLCGKYTEAIRTHLSRLLVDFLCSGVTDFRNLAIEISTCIDNFNLVCIDVECVLPLSSYIYEGIVIQRDFLNFHHSLAECDYARFVLLHNSFTEGGSKSDLSSTFEAKDIPTLDKVFLWRSQCSTALLDWMHTNKVNLIFSTGCINDTLLALCAKAGILMVQFIDKEDFERLKLLFHVTALEYVSDLFEVKPEDFIGCSEVCEAKVFGQKQFVCLKLPDRDYNCTKHSSSPTTHDRIEESCHAHQQCLKRQLVICGMSAGACQQIRLDLLNALKTLRLWLDCKWLNTKASHCSAVHVAGGGSFELICYVALRDFMRQNALQLDTYTTVCCDAVCTALLAVPLRLLHNSFQPKLSTVLYIKEKLKSSPGSASNIRGFDGSSGCQLDGDTTVIEPLMSKILVIEHVLELTEQLLRINSLLYVKKLLQQSVCKEEIVHS